MTRLIALLLLLVVPLLAADRRTAMRNYRAAAAAASGWQETNESGLVFFYDYTGTNAGNGNVVTVWPDLSGNSKHATNVNSTMTYQTGGPNGKAYIQSAGNSTDSLQNTSTFTMEGGTLLMVFQHTFTNESKSILADVAGGFGSYSIDLVLNRPRIIGRSTGWVFGGDYDAGGVFGTNWMILTHTYSSAGDYVMYDSFLVATNGNDDRTLFAPTGWSIGGANGDSRGNYRIGRLLAYDHPLTGSALTNLINKAKTDFGL